MYFSFKAIPVKTVCLDDTYIIAPQVDCLVTTAGGVEEDFIKCMAPTYMGEFNLRGSVLRDKGINRTGNLLVPNDNYCKFNDWMMPLLDAMLEEQNNEVYCFCRKRFIYGCSLYHV